MSAAQSIWNLMSKLNIPRWNTLLPWSLKYFYPQGIGPAAELGSWQRFLNWAADKDFWDCHSKTSLSEIQDFCSWLSTLFSKTLPLSFMHIHTHTALTLHWGIIFFRSVHHQKVSFTCVPEEIDSALVRAYFQGDEYVELKSTRKPHDVSDTCFIYC